MQLAYELKKSDFTESYSVHHSSKTWRKWSRRIFIWVAGLSTAMIVFGFLVKPSVQQAKGLAPFFALVAGWVGVLWLLPRWTMRRQFLAQPGAHGPRTLTLDSAGAHWRWNGGSSDI